MLQKSLTTVRSAATVAVVIGAGVGAFSLCTAHADPAPHVSSQNDSDKRASSVQSDVLKELNDRLPRSATGENLEEAPKVKKAIPTDAAIDPSQSATITIPNDGQLSVDESEANKKQLKGALGDSLATTPNVKEAAPKEATEDLAPQATITIPNDGALTMDALDRPSRDPAPPPPSTDVAPLSDDGRRDLPLAKPDVSVPAKAPPGSGAWTPWAAGAALIGATALFSFVWLGRERLSKLLHFRAVRRLD